MADFNARHSSSTGDHASNSRGAKFFELISRYPIQLERALVGLYTTNNATGLGITDLLFSASANKYTISDFIIHQDNLNGSDHWPLTWSVDVEIKSLPTSWNFKKLISNSEIRLEYSALLELNYLSIVECIEKNLVEILIQRQNTELNCAETQQQTINYLWQLIIEWIEMALKNSCGKRKNLTSLTFFGLLNSRIRKSKECQIIHIFFTNAIARIWQKGKKNYILK